MGLLTKPLPQPHLPLVQPKAPNASQGFGEWLKNVNDVLNGSGTAAILTQAQADLRYEQIGVVHGINEQTANYVLTLADIGQTIGMKVAGANTLTIPAQATVAWPVGAWFNLIQVGAGVTTLTPGAGGVVINARIGLRTSGQWAMSTVLRYSADVWIAGGALVP